HMPFNMQLHVMKCSKQVKRYKQECDASFLFLTDVRIVLTTQNLEADPLPATVV
ncbi:MAG: hypothetical protein RLZZ534_1103, partial [Actinomycetota bacterium]